jgi:hypothetical protein
MHDKETCSSEQYKKRLINIREAVRFIFILVFLQLCKHGLGFVHCQALHY